MSDMQSESTAVRVIKAYAKDINRTYAEIAEEAQVSAGTITNVMRDLSRAYINVMLSEEDDPMAFLASHYGNEVTPEELQALIPVMEKQKNKLINEEKQKEVMSATSTGGAPKVPDIDSRMKALTIVLQRIPRVGERDIQAVLELYTLSQDYYDANPQAMLALMQQLLGPQKGNLAFSNYMMILGQYLPNDQGSGLAAPVMPGVQSQFGFPQQQVAQQQNPVLQAQMQEMMMRKMSQQQEDERMERQMKMMTQAVMMSVMAKALEAKQSVPQTPFGVGGMVEEYDQNGNLIKKQYVPAQQVQPQQNNDLIGAFLKTLADQNIALIQNTLGKPAQQVDNPYKEIALKAFDKINTQSDPLDYLAKLRQAVPQAFMAGQAPTLDEVRLKMEYNDKQFMRDMELMRMRWDREDKMSDKLMQHENMKSYMDGLGKIGVDIIQPIAKKFAEGFGGSRPQPIQSAQQYAQQASQQQQQVPQTANGAPDFSSMTDEQLAAAMQEKNQIIPEINKRANQLDQEVARRQAIKSAQQHAAAAQQGSTEPSADDFPIAGLGDDSSSP